MFLGCGKPISWSVCGPLASHVGWQPTCLWKRGFLNADTPAPRVYYEGLSCALYGHVQAALLNAVMFLRLPLKSLEITQPILTPGRDELGIKIKSSSAGGVSWLEHCSIYQKVAGSIPGQGTYLGCEFDPWLGCLWEATDQCFSLTSMFLSLSLSPLLPTPL